MKTVIAVYVGLLITLHGSEERKIAKPEELSNWLDSKNELTLQEFRLAKMHHAELLHRADYSNNADYQNKVDAVAMRTSQMLIERFRTLVQTKESGEATEIFVELPDSETRGRICDILRESHDKEFAAKIIHAAFGRANGISNPASRDFPYGGLRAKGALLDELFGGKAARQAIGSDTIADHWPLFRKALEERYPALAELEGSETRKARDAAERESVTAIPRGSLADRPTKPDGGKVARSGKAAWILLGVGLLGLALAVMVAFRFNRRNT
jgi:hypothetical protein